jgi:hypothetical protein
MIKKERAMKIADLSHDRGVKSLDRQGKAEYAGAGMTEFGRTDNKGFPQGKIRD